MTNRTFTCLVGADQYPMSTTITNPGKFDIYIYIDINTLDILDYKRHKTNDSRSYTVFHVSSMVGSCCEGSDID